MEVMYIGTSWETVGVRPVLARCLVLSHKCLLGWRRVEKGLRKGEERRRKKGLTTIEKHYYREGVERRMEIFTEE